jgi:hypothetical protein
VLEVIESVNWNSVLSSSFLISYLINELAAGAVEMWESDCLADSRAR